MPTTPTPGKIPYRREMEAALPRTAPGAATTGSLMSVYSDRLWLIALILSIVPLWLVHYLPMVDLPGHAALMTALERLTAGDPAFTEQFRANWVTPYLLGYGLFFALSLILPIALAAKVIVSVAIFLTPLLTGIFLREIGADQRWKWFAIPAAYTLAFYWGFLSFVVAMPVGLWLMIETLRFDREPDLRRGLLVAAIALLALFSHIIVMGLACMCALVYIAGGRWSDPRGMLMRFVPYTSPLPLIAVWFVFTLKTVEGVQDSPIAYGRLIDRIYYLVAQPAGFEQPTLLAAVVWLAIVVLPMVCGSRWSRNPARWLPFVAVMAAFFVVPSLAFRSGFLYERLGAFFMITWLMAWDPPDPDKPRKKLDALAIVAVGVWILANTWRFSVFATETKDFRAVLDVMEPGRRTASLVVNIAPDMFMTPVYLHFASWYQAEKKGIVDFNFADFQMVVQRPDISEPRIDETLAWRPDLFDWERNGGSNYYYFLIKADFDVGTYVFRDRLDETVELAAHSGGWWLYRNREFGG